MALIARRRRNTLFIIICCVSLVIVSWYSSKPGERKFNNKIRTVVFESLIPSNQVQDINEKNFPLVEQKSDHSTTKHSQIITHFTESSKANEIQYSTKYESKKTLNIYSPEYDYEYVDPQDIEDDEIKSLFEKLSRLEERISSSEYNETPYKMPMRNHPELNAYHRIDENNPKNGKEPTPYGDNFQNLEECKVCKGKEDSTTVSDRQILEPTKNPSLILDTLGCKIPKLDPWDPSVAHLIELLDPVVCPGPPLFMRTGPNGSISLNETVLGDYYNMTADELICNYQAIYRKHEDPSVRREVSILLGNVTKLEFGVPLNEDYLGAGCKVKNKTTNFEQFFPFVRLKKEIEDERNSRTPPKPQLNVILAGIDSVSKLNFLRHFKRTLSFLNEKMSPFEMNGYTKVGDNTFPNLVPLLTGHFVENYFNESLKNTMFFDDIDLIWKDYAKRGFRTFFAEDMPMAGTFNYLKRGFYNPPTDYYLRPLYLVLDRTDHLKRDRNLPCINSQIDPDFIYDYLKDFIKVMEHRPYFAFAMVADLTHDFLNYASFADVPTVNLLQDLSDLGALNNSILVLFSDHGIRFGKIRYTYIGKYEERMPFMYIHVPKWFLDQYPEIAKNLKTNQDRLMTLFDIHATMVHLLDLNKPHGERSTATLGTSLFEEIPANRTCDDAHIKRHWCPCETFDVVPHNTYEVKNASQAIVDDINSQLKEYGDICEVLEVDEIMDAMVGKANEVVLRYVRAENEVLNKKIILGNKIKPIADYMITLTTRPGNAVFEATVRHEPISDSYNVLGISRLSMYGNTSWCIDSQKMKLFCYCKVQMKP